ncbi:GMC oxidoreductase [Streptomyces sp. NPDC001705]
MAPEPVRGRRTTTHPRTDDRPRRRRPAQPSHPRTDRRGRTSPACHRRPLRFPGRSPHAAPTRGQAPPERPCRALRTDLGTHPRTRRMAELRGRDSPRRPSYSRATRSHPHPPRLRRRGRSSGDRRPVRDPRHHPGTDLRLRPASPRPAPKRFPRPGLRPLGRSRNGHREQSTTRSRQRRPPAPLPRPGQRQRHPRTRRSRPRLRDRGTGRSRTRRPGRQTPSDGCDAFSGHTAPRSVAPMPLAVTTRPDGAHAWSGTDVVLGGAAADERVEITDRCLGLRVVLDGDTVTGVVVRDLATGVERTVAARAVVVAADALRTPQLLHASGVRPPALGRYLNDRPQIIYAVRLPDDIVAAHRAVTGRTRDEDGAIVPQSGVSWVPYTDAHPFHGQVMQLDASPVPLADDTDVEPGAVVGLGWFCAKDISPDDRVEFTDSEFDAYGLPALRIHFHYSVLATIEQAKKAVTEAGATVGVPLDDSPVLLPAGSSLHYQGTTRVGPADDGTSVCDSHSRVWNTRGLWVAGNNVIPTATACNPTLTFVALAVRGARALLDHLNATAEQSTPPVQADAGIA